MRVYKMGPKGLNKEIVKDPIAVVEHWLNSDAETGDIIEVEILEMNPEEYTSLPEYLGP